MTNVRFLKVPPCSFEGLASPGSVIPLSPPEKSQPFDVVSTHHISRQTVYDK